MRDTVKVVLNKAVNEVIEEVHDIMGEFEITKDDYMDLSKDLIFEDTNEEDY